MRFDLTTNASPEQVLRAMTDFTDRRLEIWHTTLDPKVYELRELGDTWAVAREGSPRMPFWVVVRYDWSDPRLIRWTEVESNHGDHGAGSMRIEAADEAGSRVHVEWTTHPVRTRDKVAMFLLHHTMNQLIARMWRKTLDRYASALPGIEPPPDMSDISSPLSAAKRSYCQAVCKGRIWPRRSFSISVRSFGRW